MKQPLAVSVPLLSTGAPFRSRGPVQYAILPHGGAPLPRPAEPLIVVGPALTAERLDRALECFAYPGLAELGRQQPVAFVDLPPGQPTAVGPCTVTAVPVEHEPATSPTALRVE